MNNVYLIDKPEGITSFDAVKEVRKKLSVKKAGHTGTLDPFATGLLIVCTGNFTRLADYFHRYLKTYRAIFTLGQFRDSDDITGEVIEEFEIPSFSEEEIKKALKKFEGEIFQKPPHISAKRINGKRLYRENRNERKIEPNPVKVFIKKIEIVSVNLPDIEVEITCGTGTYIRSIARDLGKNLNCGGYVSFLRRTGIGPYSVERANNLENPVPLSHIDILPDIEAVVLDMEKTKRILAGNEIFLAKYQSDTDYIRVFSSFFNQLLALCKVEKKNDGVIIKPEKVFFRGEL